MGSLYYGNSDQPIAIPDRLLAHVRAVVTTKLRRDESFALNWRHADDVDRGRSTIWIHASIPLRFVFEASEPETLDTALLNDLASAANSAGGLNLDLRSDVSATSVGRADVGRAA